MASGTTECLDTSLVGGLDLDLIIPHILDGRNTSKVRVRLHLLARQSVRRESVVNQLSEAWPVHAVMISRCWVFSTRD